MLLALLPVLLTCLHGCRKDMGVEQSTKSQVMAPGAYRGAGFYLLNEGNMGSNKASLDYFNPMEGTYFQNIYGSVNPGATLGLGDVGNDLKVYGGKLYVVVNGSNKVEILDKYTAIKLGQLNIDNCRSIVFNGSKAYVSSYNGYVAVFDTAQKFNGKGVGVIENQIKVGREPEGMSIIGDTLYVANSGGYSPPLYDNTLSVIDLKKEMEVRKIKVGINLNQVNKDGYGHLWVSSRGNYEDIDPSLFVLDVQKGSVTRQMNIQAGSFIIRDSLLYYFSAPYEKESQKPISITYGVLNTALLQKSDKHFISDAAIRKIKLPYALALDPLTGEILLTDAGDHISPGNLYWLNNAGDIQWQVMTGEIPGHIAFIQ